MRYCAVRSGSWFKSESFRVEQVRWENAVTRIRSTAVAGLRWYVPDRIAGGDPGVGLLLAITRPTDLFAGKVMLRHGPVVIVVRGGGGCDDAVGVAASLLTLPMMEDHSESKLGNHSLSPTWIAVGGKNGTKSRSFSIRK